MLGHSIAGMSWEGFVLETLQNVAGERVQFSFYRTFTGTEINLLLKLPCGKLWAVEIKKGSSAKPNKGFYSALEDLSVKCNLNLYQ